MVSKRIQFNHISEEHEDSLGAFTVQIRHTSIPDADFENGRFPIFEVKSMTWSSHCDIFRGHWMT